MKDHVSKVQYILAWLLAKPEDDPVVIDEIQDLVATVHHETEAQQSSVLKEIFASNDSTKHFAKCSLEQEPPSSNRLEEQM